MERIQAAVGDTSSRAGLSRRSLVGMVGKESSCNKRKMRQSSSLKNWVGRTAGGADSNSVDMQTL